MFYNKFMFISGSLSSIGKFRVMSVYALFILLYLSELAFTPTFHGAPTSFSLTLGSLFIFIALFGLPMPLILIMVIGLLTDLFSSAPLGLFTLIYIALFYVSGRQSTFLTTQSFPVVWIAYGLVLLIAQILIWLGYSFYYESGFSTYHLTMDLFYGFFAFPFIYSLYHIVLYAFPKEEEDL